MSGGDFFHLPLFHFFVLKRITHFTKPLCTGCLLLALGWLCLSACQSRSPRAADTAAPLPQPEVGPLAANGMAVPAGQPAPQPPTGPPPKDLHHKTLQNPDGTWGYDLLGDGRLLVHQPNIPALPGNAGFATEAQAARVAQAALQKIKNGESLPTLSAEEVRGLMAN